MRACRLDIVPRRDLSFGKQTIAPVSYTHLDVYKRQVWALAEDPMAKQLGRLAGLSALAQYSMLAEPKWPVYALSATEWKAATVTGLQELPEPVAGARELQLWSYSPALLPGVATVDPLSLTLSPVSYTHLDVYKRQALLRGALSMMKVSHIDLLVVGLPVALFAVKKAALEKAMTGRHRCV